MKHLVGTLVVALSCAACGGGTKAAAPAAPAAASASAGSATARPATGGAVELGELKFYAGDDLGLQMHANGHFEVKVAAAKWQEVGAIGPDGTIMSPDGAKHGEIKPDGSVIGPQGQLAPFKLDGDTLVVANKKLSIDDKGMLQGGNDMTKPMRIDGATTPGLKRTALLLLALLLSAPEPNQPAP